jgi:hypothetical protein
MEENELKSTKFELHCQNITKINKNILQQKKNLITLKSKQR